MGRKGEGQGEKGKGNRKREKREGRTVKEREERLWDMIMIFSCKVSTKLGSECLDYTHTLVPT